MRLAEYCKVRELTNKSSHHRENSFTPHIFAKVDITVQLEMQGRKGKT